MACNAQSERGVDETGFGAGIMGNDTPKFCPKKGQGKLSGTLLMIIRGILLMNINNNNLAENAIRPIALGRKNWLFCGNHGAAENAAIMYSMLGCCKAAGVNFRDWLVFFFDNIHRYDNDYSKDLAELLPHNCKLQNQNCNSILS